VEVALAVAGRAQSASTRAGLTVTLVSDSDVLLAEYAPSAQRLALTACARTGVRVRLGTRVHEVQAAAVVFTGGESLPSDITVWVAGAAAPALIANSAVPRSATGYLAVDSTLRATDGSPIWGAGDCITLRDDPWVPKAGVYAVREGPILAHNLRVALTGEGAPERYTPQSGFLSILSLGDGRAIAHWRGLALEGAWAMTLKHRIDTAFMRRYRAVENSSD
jgi:selenide,water dikinase